MKCPKCAVHEYIAVKKKLGGYMRACNGGKQNGGCGKWENVDKETGAAEVSKRQGESANIDSEALTVESDNAAGVDTTAIAVTPEQGSGVDLESRVSARNVRVARKRKRQAPVVRKSVDSSGSGGSGSGGSGSGSSSSGDGILDRIFRIVERF